MMRLACLFSYAVILASAQPYLALSPVPERHSMVVVLGQAENAKIAGLQWTIKFSPSDLSITSVVPAGASEKTGKQIQCGAPSGAYTCIVSGLNRNLIGDGAVAIVEFRLLKDTATVELTNKRGSTPDGVPVSIPGVSRLRINRKK